MASLIHPTLKISGDVVRDKSKPYGKVLPSREGTFVAREGLVLLSIYGRLSSETDIIQFFIKNHNAAERRIAVVEGKELRFTKEDVESVYGLYRGGSKVTWFVEENDIDDLQIWASDLKFP
ncbi:hypothetical protein LINGRAHAP2_LOCUS4017 [Linum grandiflorum]